MSLLVGIDDAEAYLSAEGLRAGEVMPGGQGGRQAGEGGQMRLWVCVNCAAGVYLCAAGVYMSAEGVRQVGLTAGGWGAMGRGRLLLIFPYDMQG